MNKPRREFLEMSRGMIVVLWLSGCSGLREGDGGGPDPEHTTDAEGGDDMENTRTQTDGETDAKDVPELANPLPGLVGADDRETFAETYDLDYRNGEVKVRIALEENAERPDEHLSEVTDEYGDTVIAWVKVDKLVPLARHENVALVSPHIEPKTDSE